MESTIQGYRLSHQQERLLNLHGNKESYISQFAVHLDGNLNVVEIKSFIEALIKKHEIFSTTFEYLPGMKLPVQVIDKPILLKWNNIDLDSQLQVGSNKNNRIDKILEQERIALKQNLNFPIRVTLVKFSNEEYTLIITMSSLYSDSWAIKNMVLDLTYTLENNGIKYVDNNEEEILQYLQFSEFQHSLIEEKESEEGLIFWKENKEENKLIRLPFQSKINDQETFEPKIISEKVHPILYKQLKEIASLYSMSISDVLYTCCQLLISKLTGVNTITTGYIDDGRQYEEFYNIYGPFIKTLPIETTIGSGELISTALNKVSASIQKAKQWQEYFFNNEKSAYCSVLYKFDDFSQLNSQKLKFYKQYVYHDKFNIMFNCIESAQGLYVELYYDHNKFEEDAVSRILDQFINVVNDVVNDTTIKFNDLQLLKSDEKKQLLFNWNNTAIPLSQNSCIHHIFEQKAELYHNQIAVFYEGKKLDYKELNYKANQLAHYLMKLGVSEDTRVGICIDRSIDMIIGILGIMKAGGAYVPLDPKFPNERLKFMIEDAKISVLLTQEKYDNKFSSSKNSVVLLDKDWISIQKERSENPQVVRNINSLIYVIYTSGSTGVPKGVGIEHRHLLNYINDRINRFNFNESHSHATVSTLAADLGNTPIILSLCTGGKLHIISEERLFNPAQMVDYFKHNQIDLLKIVPSHLEALLNIENAELILPKKWLIVGGESFSYELLNKIQQFTHECLIVNEYGPTEATIGTIDYVAKQECKIDYTGSVLIGRPISNTKIYILDEYLNPVPIGVPGELYISGKSVARGYLGRSELTSEKFIKNPFDVDSEYKVMYKTGDYALYLPDGNVEFLGRMDNQVKIRGFRVELEEIENCLRQHEDIDKVFVKLFKGSKNDDQIVAYILLNSPKKDFNEQLLRQYVENNLPSPFVPRKIIKLDKVPLNPNGKIDHKALPSPNSEFIVHREAVYVSPKTTMEKEICGLWSEVLGIHKVSIKDVFFEIGGDSLKCVELLYLLNQKYEKRLVLADLFKYKTVESLSSYIEELTNYSDSNKGDIAGYTF
ncbi:amino acid adenylation domain-containing protein [Bacillus atrophaeus]|uniref:amino acid adenylation domain-containing protein n=4 Tax=Bacillus atrophaeus TaxID=1452 RepID=UPI00227E9572|nr:amino acid adenylation domain-containing protein [Bacillus atrophaeus]MCY8814957.1 amino acid adenylation domain-containing protein [Bacillus atrophaeus]MCY8823113.1 amino acid adenylation domain-containing protein [Bacillus atrophaeus]MCY8834838.1 amino acid adenylation domain-containing protein [Bacillus atrophaeus]MEC0752067.1 amino acid adenylation domain-containing protein [Bacillus atrophaeus]MEC0814751.1 amino acid adenylation domain-containing protein [Bacillus atrophaeus]